VVAALDLGLGDAAADTALAWYDRHVVASDRDGLRVAPLALPAATGDAPLRGQTLGMTPPAVRLAAHDGDAGLRWRALRVTPPVVGLAVQDGVLWLTDRTGAHALGRDFAPQPDARDAFRLDGGRLFAGAGGLVGLRDRPFALGGTARLRAFAPLPDPAASIRDYVSPAQVRALVPAAAGTWMALSAAGLWFLPAGEHTWERIALPGAPPRGGAELPVALAASEGAVWVGLGACLWRAADVPGAPPAPAPVARALLVFPRGPDPALAGTMVYPDEAGAMATGAVWAAGALWYAARAVPGEQPGTLVRADAAGERPARAGTPPDPAAPLAAQDLVLDAEAHAWVVLEDRALRLDALACADASGGAGSGSDSGAGAPGPEPLRGADARDAVGVATRPNSDAFSAACTSAAALERALDGPPRPITAIAFTREAAIVAVAGGPDLRRPLATMTSFVHRSRVVHVPLAGDTPPLPVADDAADPTLVAVRAIAARGREVHLATAFGLRAFWRRAAPDGRQTYEPLALGAFGVDLPPWVHLAFVHAGRDRLLVEGLAWKRRKEDVWHRWTGERLERYAGGPRVDPVVRGRGTVQARPYLAERDPGWVALPAAPAGLTVTADAATAAAETAAAVFIGTHAGLVRYDESRDEYDTLDAARGLQTGRINSLRVCDDHVLVSTIDGVFVVV
jgi:hypothetical protein